MHFIDFSNKQQIMGDLNAYNRNMIVSTKYCNFLLIFKYKSNYFFISVFCISSLRLESRWILAFLSGTLVLSFINIKHQLLNLLAVGSLFTLKQKALFLFKFNKHTSNSFINPPLTSLNQLLNSTETIIVRGSAIQNLLAVTLALLGQLLTA